jgi:hypothetical protein
MTHEELLKLAQTGELTEDLILKITQETRRNMLVAELQQGIPSGKGIYRALKLLEDMDATALNVKKIDTDDDNADADRKASVMIASMNRQLDGINPFQANSDNQRPEKDITPDASEIPFIEPKHEENAIGVSSLTYDEFVVEQPEIK